MCWSFPVAISFSAGQLLATLILVFRNKHYDRCLACMQIPIMLQEFGQAMQWWYIGDNSFTCPVPNHGWGNFTQMSWGSVALVMSCVLIKIEGGMEWRKYALYVCSLIAFVGWVANDVVWRNFIMEPFCSYRGACGHLVWQPSGDTPSWFDPLYNVSYLGVMLALALLAKTDDGRCGGKWTTSGIMLIGFGTLIPLSTYFNQQGCGEEWGSVW